MKKLNFEQMENVNGGDCLNSLLLYAGASAFMCTNPAGWLALIAGSATLVATARSVYQDCNYLWNG